MSGKYIFNCMKVSLFLACMQFFQAAFGQYDLSAIDKRLEAAKKELGGKYAFMVYKDGKVIYQKAFGEEFTVKTQVPIGMSSQWITAAAVMSFVDEGKLALDDKVSKYIPLLTKYSKGYITIKDCLANLTGLEGSIPKSLKELQNRKRYENLDAEITDFISSREILSNPGLEFRYNTIGLNMASRVLEIITRRGFEQIVAERITRPMQMRSTTYSNFNAVNPAGGAQSSAQDYITFLGMILNQGMYNGKRILSEKAIADMETAWTTSQMMRSTPRSLQGLQYGFGQWILATDAAGKSTVIASPGLFGTWPLIDRCRGYAMVLVTQQEMDESKGKIVDELKAMIDAVIPATHCQ